MKYTKKTYYWYKWSRWIIFKAEFLLSKGYEVHGILKRNSVSENQTYRLDNSYKDLILHYGDMTDLSSLIYVIQKSNPDEIYNLAPLNHM